MSTVTNVVLMAGLADADGVEEINRWLADNGGLLKAVDSHAGGNKIFQAGVYIGAFNYLDHAALIKVFLSAKWAMDAVLALKREQDGWVLYRAKGAA